MTLTMNGFTADSSLATFCYPDPSFDHPPGLPEKCIIVIHDAEDRPTATAGMARSLIGPDYWGHGGDAGNPTSPHYMTDPVDIAQGVHEADRAWHCGPHGNAIGIGIEQSGRVSETRAEWSSSPNGQAERRNTARLIVDICRRRPNIKPRKLSDAELAAVYQAAVANPTVAQTGGYVSHDQITRVLGGTTHTDPEPNYPWDLLAADIAAILAPPAPAPADLLEWIMSLPGAPAGLTYQQYLTDQANALLGASITVRNSLRTPPDQSITVGTLLADLLNFTSSNVAIDLKGK